MSDKHLKNMQTFRLRYALLFLCFFVVFALGACSPKAKAPSANSGQKIELPALEIVYIPPRLWTPVEDGLIEAARKTVGEKDQIGLFNARLEAAYINAELCQIAFSSLSPNASYPKGQSILSQLNRHAVEIRHRFAEDADVSLDRMQIGGFTVIRIAGKTEVDYFSKMLFLNEKTESSQAFSIDVSFPAGSDIQQASDDVAACLASIVELKLSTK